MSKSGEPFTSCDQVAAWLFFGHLYVIAWLVHAQESY